MTCTPLAFARALIPLVSLPADLGKKVTLIERYESLGGVCLNVGCTPGPEPITTTWVLIIICLV
jgi:hypothetical protein